MWTEGGPRVADVLVEDGRIAAIGDLGSGVAAGERIDARGMRVLPGFVDVHIHVDDEIGRFALADDFASGSRAAITTGITTLAAFATQRRGETLTECVERYLAKAAGRSLCDYTFHITPTQWPWPWHELEALVERGFRTFKLYTTYRPAGLYTSWEQLAEVMPGLAQLGAQLLIHCEDDEVLAAVDPASVDLTRPESHGALRPERAEVEAVRRVLALSEQTECPVHVVHVSTADAAELIEGARRFVPVTYETGPHYLLLDEQALAGRHGHRLLCTPPLRAEQTRARLEELAGHGGIDLFATDHCAFRTADKDSWDGTDLRQVPCGIAGIGALVPLCYELLCTRYDRPLGELANRLAAKPARLLGARNRKGALRVGADADIVVVDPAGTRRPIRSTLADAPDPWGERNTTWDVSAVLLRGELVADRNGVVNRTATGRPLTA